jgi:hypothetical protein
MGVLGAILSGCRGLRILGPGFQGPEYWSVIQTVSESEDLFSSGVLVSEVGGDIE